MTIDFEKMAKGESIDGDNNYTIHHKMTGYHPETAREEHAKLLAKVLFGVFVSDQNLLFEAIDNPENKLAAIRLYEKFYLKLNESVNELLEDELSQYKEAVDKGLTERTKQDFRAITRPAMLTACIHLTAGVVYNISNNPNGILPLLNVVSILLQQVGLAFAAGLEKEKQGEAISALEELMGVLKDAAQATEEASSNTTDGNSGHTTSDNTSSSGENTSDGPQH